MKKIFFYFLLMLTKATYSTTECQIITAKLIYYLDLLKRYAKQNEQIDDLYKNGNIDFDLFEDFYDDAYAKTYKASARFNRLIAFLIQRQSQEGQMIDCDENSIKLIKEIHQEYNDFVQIRNC